MEEMCRISRPVQILRVTWNDCQICEQETVERIRCVVSVISVCWVWDRSSTIQSHRLTHDSWKHNEITQCFVVAFDEVSAKFKIRAKIISYVRFWQFYFQSNCHREVLYFWKFGWVSDFFNFQVEFPLPFRWCCLRRRLCQQFVSTLPWTTQRFNVVVVRSVLNRF